MAFLLYCNAEDNAILNTKANLREIFKWIIKSADLFAYFMHKGREEIKT